MTISSTVTNNTLTVFVAGKHHALTSEDMNFGVVKDALAKQASEDQILDLMDPDRVVRRWSAGQFFVDAENRVCDSDGPVPEVISTRIRDLIRTGQSPNAVCAFWARLKTNPSRRSVTQLFDFLSHVGIPLTETGHFLAYKSVRPDLRDHHSGKWENTPGKVLSMSRNQISDDPREACHEGFHVGALDYAATFGGPDRKIVICKVDPADVVCVPYDSSHQKMRVCRYEVVGFHTGALPEHVVEESELPQLERVEVSSLEEEAESQKLKSEDSGSEISDEELLAMSLQDLRVYASKHCKIVGASKMPGGKWALLELVMSNRS